MATLKSFADAVGRIVAPEDYAPIEKTEEQLKNQLIDEIIIAEDNEFKRWGTMFRDVCPKGNKDISEMCDWEIMARGYKQTLETVMNKLRKPPHGLSIREILKELADREETFWKPMRNRMRVKYNKGKATLKEWKELPEYRKITEVYWRSSYRTDVDFPILNKDGDGTEYGVLRRLYDGPLGASKRKGKKATKKKGKKATKKKDKKATKKKDKKATKKRGKKATKKTRRRNKSI